MRSVVGARRSRGIAAWVLVTLAVAGVACGPVRDAERAVPAGPATSAPAPAPSAEAAPAARDAGVPSRAAALAERFRQGDPIASELGALDAAERDELAGRIDALLADPSFVMPVRPALDILGRAWSRRAESIVARYLAHDDPSVREHARAILRARGLSSAAVALAILPSDGGADARASVADAVTHAPDASVASVEGLCRSIPTSSEADWVCTAALTRLGSSGARATLLAKTKATCATAPPRDAIARLEWLAKELGKRAPWRELAAQLQNMRAEPVGLCGDNFDSAPSKNCETVGHDPPVGDTFLRVVVRVHGFTVSFSLAERTFTKAQRAEVLRLLSAVPSS